MRQHPGHLAFIVGFKNQPRIQGDHPGRHGKSVDLVLLENKKVKGVLRPVRARHQAKPHVAEIVADERVLDQEDRKSTRLNSSHVAISYAVFCLKKKQKVWNLG